MEKLQLSGTGPCSSPGCKKSNQIPLRDVQHFRTKHLGEGKRCLVCPDRAKGLTLFLQDSKYKRHLESPTHKKWAKKKCQMEVKNEAGTPSKEQQHGDGPGGAPEDCMY